MSGEIEDILLAREGDQKAFERLYRSRFGPISRYVGSIVRDRDRAEDIVAQTFLLAWRDLGKLRLPERFDAWLYRIAHNQTMSEFSRRRPTTSLDDTPEIADEGRFALPERILDDADDARRVREALVLLPESHRQVLFLKFYRELSPSEIAQQLGKNEASVWSLTYRALQNLKRAMDKEPGSPRLVAQCVAAEAGFKCDRDSGWWDGLVAGSLGERPACQGCPWAFAVQVV
jgi:RNA polymerase sigma-70 factor, ECF subfamily